MDLKEILSPGHNDSFRYWTLSRMKADCEYYLGYGRAYQGHLWAGSEKEHIAAMKAIWNYFPEDGKPDWPTMDDILRYEKRMNVHSAIRDYMKFEEETSAAYPFAATYGRMFDADARIMLAIEEKCAGQTDTEIVHAAILAVVGPNPAPSGEETVCSEG